MNDLKKVAMMLKAKEKKKKKNKNMLSFNEGGEVIKEKVVSTDSSPNSGLITTKGFGASRRT